MINRAIHTAIGTAICVAMLSSGAVARDQDDALSAARQVKTDVAGLKAPAQILVDVWGIPHIYADNEHDLFFLQGFNAARDRLWQIDLWRKRGLGLLAQDFGPAYAEQDKALRLFLYRGDMNGGVGVLRAQGARPMRKRSSPASTPMSPTCARASVRCRSSSGSPARCRIRGRRRMWCGSAATA